MSVVDDEDESRDAEGDEKPDVDGFLSKKYTTELPNQLLRDFRRNKKNNNRYICR